MSAEKGEIKGERRRGNKKGVDAVSGLSPILVIFPPSSCFTIFRFLFLARCTSIPERERERESSKTCPYIAGCGAFTEPAQGPRGSSRIAITLPHLAGSRTTTARHILRSFFPPPVFLSCSIEARPEERTLAKFPSPPNNGKTLMLSDLGRKERERERKKKFSYFTNL